MSLGLIESYPVGTITLDDILPLPLTPPNDNSDNDHHDNDGSIIHNDERDDGNGDGEYYPLSKSWPVNVEPLVTPLQYRDCRTLEWSTYTFQEEFIEVSPDVIQHMMERITPGCTPLEEYEIKEISSARDATTTIYNKVIMCVTYVMYITEPIELYVIPLTSEDPPIPDMKLSDDSATVLSNIFLRAFHYQQTIELLSIYLEHQPQLPCSSCSQPQPRPQPQQDGQDSSAHNEIMENKTKNLKRNRGNDNDNDNDNDNGHDNNAPVYQHIHSCDKKTTAMVMSTHTFASESTLAISNDHINKRARIGDNGNDNCSTDDSKIASDPASSVSMPTLSHVSVPKPLLPSISDPSIMMVSSSSSSSSSLQPLRQLSSLPLVSDNNETKEEANSLSKVNINSANDHQLFLLPPNQILMVENLPASCTDTILLEPLFSKYDGFIRICLLNHNPHMHLFHGKSVNDASVTRIAFIHFTNHHQSGHAMEQLQGYHIIPNQPMKISFAFNLQ